MVAHNAFDFSYIPLNVVYGRGCVDTLDETLADLGRDRALVVCGSNVGANRVVMDAVEAGLGDRLQAVFDETTPEKRMETVLDGVDRMRAEEIDVLVAVGGGSSLNVARAMSAIAAGDQPRDVVLDEVRETGRVLVSDESVEPIPNIAIPTTMAGADLSSGGGVHHTSEIHISDPRLMAKAIYYDPALFATTPSGLLASSAMNGFDKGIETLYSRSTNPIADAHALNGLRYYSAGLPDIRDAPPDDAAFDQAVIGTILVQYRNLSNIIHTFGNGVSFDYDVQQGTVHGIMAPHVLRYVFNRVDGRRHRIAEGLGIDLSDRSDDAVAEAVIETVIRIRDGLRIPSRLRVVDGLVRDQLPDVARAVADNHKHNQNPPGIDPTTDDILSILELAW